MAGKIGIYGPRVIGEAAYEAEKKIVKQRSHIYGPRVLGEPQKPATTAKGGDPDLGGANPPAPQGEGTPSTPPAVQNRPAVIDPANPPAVAHVAPVIDPRDPPQVETTPAASSAEAQDAASGAAGDDAYLSIEDIKKAVLDNPAVTDRLMAAELNRLPKPRKGALLFFIEREQAREGGPRAAFLASLETALKAIG